MDTISAYRRSRSRFDEFPSLQHSPPPPSSPLRAPYSSASLGPSFRSRSLDQRRFPVVGNDLGTISRTFYTSKPGGGGGRIYGSSASSRYKGELFDNKVAQQRPALATPSNYSAGSAYRSSSHDRQADVTIVPIRREATLPARNFEWRTSNWRSSSGGTPIISPMEDSKEQEQQEYTTFNRSVLYNHQRKVWPPPPSGIYGHGRRASERAEFGGTGGGGTIYHPATDSATADYSFRRSQQAESDAAQQQQQHQEHLQQGRHQRSHRSHREWHSSGGGGGHMEQQHYGMYGGRSGREDGVGVYREGSAGGREGGGGGGGWVDEKRYRNEYANGWGGGTTTAQYPAKRGFFGSGSKSKSSSSGARWSTPYRQQQKPSAASRAKQYRKIRCCCFNLIWPPWAMEPAGPPKPMYANGNAAGPTERSVPIEQQQFDDRRLPPPDRDGSVPIAHWREQRTVGAPIGRSASLEENHRIVDQQRRAAGEPMLARRHHYSSDSPPKWGRRD